MLLQLPSGMLYRNFDYFNHNIILIGFMNDTLKNFKIITEHNLHLENAHSS